MPIRRLSAANIKRARRNLAPEMRKGGRYHRLSARRKNRILFKTAWRIQKARRRRLHHR